MKRFLSALIGGAGIYTADDITTAMRAGPR